jgi:hypothetical protein
MGSPRLTPSATSSAYFRNRSLLTSAPLNDISYDFYTMQTEPSKIRIVVAATGSVAAMKLPELLRLLLPWAQVKLVTSESVKVGLCRRENSF